MTIFPAHFGAKLIVRATSVTNTVQLPVSPRDFDFVALTEVIPALQSVPEAPGEASTWTSVRRARRERKPRGKMSAGTPGGEKHTKGGTTTKAREFDLSRIQWDFLS